MSNDGKEGWRQPTVVFEREPREFKKPLQEFPDGFFLSPSSRIEGPGRIANLHRFGVLKNAQHILETKTKGIIFYGLEGVLQVASEKDLSSHPVQPGAELYLGPESKVRLYSAETRPVRFSLMTVEPVRSKMEYVYLPQTQEDFTIPLSGKEISEGDSRGPNDKMVKFHAPKLFLHEIKFNKNYPRKNSRCELHRWRGEIWLELEGELMFEVGGEMIDPYFKREDQKDVLSKDVRGGIRFVLRPGDQLYVPEGVPHMHHTKENAAARVLFTKVHTSQFIPIEKIPGWKS